jgi:D-alanyl-D-alanine-carboxypeptidase/D-alanyl-D-alanine-endopeptidase
LLLSSCRRHCFARASPHRRGDSLVTRTEITLDPKIFDRYTGVYQFTPAITLTFTREGARMFTQLTNQPKFEIFAESEKEFFLKVVDAQISFETGEDGRATAATLHQNGRDQKAKRVEQ